MEFVRFRGVEPLNGSAELTVEASLALYPLPKGERRVRRLTVNWLKKARSR